MNIAGLAFAAVAHSGSTSTQQALDTSGYLKPTILNTIRAGISGRDIKRRSRELAQRTERQTTSSSDSASVSASATASLPDGGMRDVVPAIRVSSDDQPSTDLPLSPTLAGGDLDGALTAVDEEEFEYECKPCPHLKKSCRMGRISPKIRELKKVSSRVCKTCEKETKLGNAGETSTSSKDGADAASPPQLWLCLCCGNLFCGRYDKAHAQQHHERLPQDCVMWNIDSHATWCYACDDDVRPDAKRKRNEVLITVDKYWDKHAGNKPDHKDSSAEEDFAKPLEVEKLDYKATAPGLTNLGNTCYFNSVVQVLASVDRLRGIVAPTASVSVEGESSMVSKISAPQAPLTAAFCKQLRDMYNNDKEKATLRPASLFGEIHRQYPKFTRGSQQDAQELFHFLLDGLKEEETRAAAGSAIAADRESLRGDEPPMLKRTRSRRHTISSIHDDGASTPTPENPVVGKSTSSTEPWKPHGYIEEIFEGRLASIVVCSACKSVSTTYDQFEEISLSLVSAGKGGGADDDDKGRRGRYSLRNAMHGFSRRAREGVSLTRSSSRSGRTATSSSSSKFGLSINTSKASGGGAASAVDAQSGLLTPREQSRARRDPATSMSEAVSEEEEDNEAADKQLKLSSFSLSEAKKRLERLSFAFSNRTTPSNSFSSPSGTRSKRGSVDASAADLCGSAAAVADVPSVDQARLQYIDRVLREVEPSETLKGSIEDSLRDFTQVEVLEGPNAFACEECAKIMQKKRLDRQALRQANALALAAASASASAQGGERSSSAGEPMEGVIGASDAVSLGSTMSPVLQPIRPSLSTTSSYMDVDSRTDNEEGSVTSAGTTTTGTIDRPPRSGGSAATLTDADEDKTAPKYILRKAFKRFLIADLPEILVLHLKRFQQSGKSMYSSLKKVDDAVRFEAELDLSPYLMPPTAAHDDASNAGTADGGGVAEQEVAVVAGCDGARYRCIGCIVHIGSIHSGHYVAYFLSHKVVGGSDGQLAPVGAKGTDGERRWLFASDASVRPASWEEVKKCRAYLVFYERIHEE